MENSKVFNQKVIKTFSNVFMGIGKLDGTVKINLQYGGVPYQAGPRKVAYVLQKPLQEELDRLIK